MLLLLLRQHLWQGHAREEMSGTFEWLETAPTSQGMWMLGLAPLAQALLTQVRAVRPGLLALVMIEKKEKKSLRR